MTERISEIKCLVQGHPSKELFVYPGISQCGSIKDGIAFRFGDQGSWVLKYNDLLRIVGAASETRRNA
jgi:hypothetical protein